MSTALATQNKPLAQRFAENYGVDPAKLFSILKATAFRQRGNSVVTDDQMIALLVVADQFSLNPFCKEIFAFEDKGAIIPVVSVDGWSRIINEHSAFNGLEFRYCDKITTPVRGKSCPEWCEVVIYRKDREHPTVVREYLDEVYQPPRGKDGGYDGPWQSHTKRMLRHKTLIQGSRIAFGFAGIYDEDEAERIIDGEYSVVKPGAAATVDDVTVKERERLWAIVKPFAEHGMKALGEAWKTGAWVNATGPEKAAEALRDRELIGDWLIQLKEIATKADAEMAAKTKPEEPASAS